jgi:hypothetical protein
VTSLTSLGTGLPPGQHGLVGYTSRVPSTGEILNALTWESDLLPRAFQAKATLFERAVASGVAVTSVALERFQGSGLTEAALRGADFVGFQHENDMDERVELVGAAATRAGRTLVYAYERELDHCGHVDGCHSVAWRRQLRRIDRMCERLRAALPDDVRLVITGDHGMVDVPRSIQIIAEDEPILMAGVSAHWRARRGSGSSTSIGTGPRGSQTGGGPARGNGVGPDSRRGDRRRLVRSVDDHLRERWGHVLVAMRDDHAVMTRQFIREWTLIGMHGSLTPAEMTVRSAATEISRRGVRHPRRQVAAGGSDQKTSVFPSWRASCAV